MTSGRRTCRCTALRTASTCPPPPPSCSTRRPASGVSRKGRSNAADALVNYRDHTLDTPLRSAMNRFDFVIIGAGPAGEAAAYKARALGASVAIADRLWFGGSCPHIGCLPSKSLLHSSEVHAAGTDYPWRRASERRDYIVNRPRDAAE